MKVKVPGDIKFYVWCYWLDFDFSLNGTRLGYLMTSLLTKCQYLKNKNNSELMKITQGKLLVLDLVSCRNLKFFILFYLYDSSLLYKYAIAGEIFN